MALPQSRPHHLVRLRPRGQTLHVSHGRTVLATRRDGYLEGGPELGLFVNETRLLSLYRLLINGVAPVPVALSNVQQNTWLGYYIMVPPGARVGPEDWGSGQMEPLSEHTLEIRVSRLVSEGIHEDICLTNFTQQPTTFVLQLQLDADFADQAETRRTRIQHGQLRRRWGQAADGAWSLRWDYRARHGYRHQDEKGVASLHRGLTLRIGWSDTAPRYRAPTLSFPVTLAPQQSWHACLDFIPYMDGAILWPLHGCNEFHAADIPADLRRHQFLTETTRFSTSESETLAQVVVPCLTQAKEDLAALRLYDLDVDTHAWTMAAGLPMYVAIYGRDALTAAWQASLVCSDIMRGTLTQLARWQGSEVNDWRDERPGRMLHEAHGGPLAKLNYQPWGRYYGSQTTSAFYPVALSELWHWSGDKDVLRSLVDPALKALQWLDDDAARNAHGFYQYQTRSQQGVKHQGWKDSPDAMVHEDGSPAEPPIATCEEQGFVYAAKLQLSEALWWLGERDLAKQLYRQAYELKQRFNGRFWMADRGFLAMGLRHGKTPIKSIGSNAGHCLATGILDESLVKQVAQRLLAPDLFTGWGIRTLSSLNPAYNPYSYHRGTVWPVEHGSFALGFLRFGLHDHVHRIARAQFEAASHFDFLRLPELFSGHPRDAEHPFPAIYPQANSPQAWSASTVFCLIQAMLGLYPYAPLRLLLLDPHLPAWLPDLTLERLRVANAVVTLKFHRDARGHTHYRVTHQQGRLHVLQQPSPWSLTAGPAERVVDVLRSLLPGK